MKYKDKLKGHKGEKMGVVFSELFKGIKNRRGVKLPEENECLYFQKQLPWKPMSVEESTLQLQITYMEFWSLRMTERVRLM